MRSLRKQSGVIESLSIFGSFIESKTSVESISSRSNINEIDVIILAVKDNYDLRDLVKDEQLPAGLDEDVRTVGIGRDLPLVIKTCNGLLGYRGMIVVVTNPVDLIATLIKRMIPQAIVIGLGVSVDAARYAYTCQKNGISRTAQDIPLGGLHIGRPIPLRSHWTTHHEDPPVNQTEMNRMLESSLEIGPRLVANLGFTLHDCGEAFARDIEWLVTPEPARPYLYASYASEESSTAIPIQKENGVVYSALGTLNREELNAIESGKQKIRDWADEITHKGLFSFPG
jgi:malate/lactate dehydrogenase